MTTLHHLAELARGATPGIRAVHPALAQVDEFIDGEPVPLCRMLWPTEDRTEDQTYANARLIAACHPALILAMCDVIEAAKAADGWLRYIAMHNADVYSAVINTDGTASRSSMHKDANALTDALARLDAVGVGEK